MLIYLILINAIAFICMLVDKQNAIKGLRRIPEATLLLLAAVGGCLGAYAGMYLCRHKTRKPKFYIGVPLILALYAVLAIILARIY